MKKAFKIIQQLVNKLLRPFKLELQKIYPEERGQVPLADVSYYFSATEVKTCVDVGANIGQTVVKLNEVYPNAQVIAFEPGQKAFRELEKVCAQHKKSNAINLGLGAISETKSLHISNYSDMSSFLQQGTQAWGKIEREETIEIATLDQQATALAIEHINFLKVDTQGFDFEVLKGASSLLKNQKIDIILIEHIFSKLYTTLPQLDEVLAYLRANNYVLLAIYPPVYQKGMLGWTDILFASQEFMNTKFKS